MVEQNRALRSFPCFRLVLIAKFLVVLCWFPPFLSAQAGPIVSYSTYLPKINIDGTFDFGGAILSVDPSGAACVTDGKALYGYDTDGNITFTLPDVLNSAPGIITSAVFRDQQGNCYLAGGVHTLQANATTIGFANVAIAKLSPAGAVLYVTYFGGNPANGGSSPGAITVDSMGNVFLTGVTTSPDLPLKNQVQNLLEGTEDAFILGLDSTGSHLLYSTFFGSNVSGTSIAVDSGQNVYITGHATNSGATIPATSGAFQSSPPSPQPAFAAKIALTGALVYATYLGGSAFDDGLGIAADANGSAYVTGNAHSMNFPTTPGAFQTAAAAIPSGFLTKLSADGSALVYSTYFGGTDGVQMAAIALDSSGAAYVTGQAEGAHFPLLNPVQADFLVTDNQGGFFFPGQAFVTSFNPAGSALQYSTFWGGFSPNFPSTIGVDAAHNAYIAGAIEVNDAFPLLNASNGVFQPFSTSCFAHFCASLGFLAKISPITGTALASPSGVDFGTLPLGSGSSQAEAILVVDASPTGLTINNTVITGDYSISNNTCSGSLPSGKHCEVDVIFSPKAGGKRTGVLTIASTAPDSPRNIELTGIGGVPIVSLNPGALNLTSPKVGTAGPAETVVLRNTGLDTLNISGLTIVGPNSADFSETHDCASTVGAGNSCNVNVTYTASTANPESASLQFTDNAAGSPQTVPLTGVVSAFGLAVAPGASPSATISAGQTATYSLMIGGPGFSGNVSISCSGAPAAATCNVPNSETLSSAPISFQAMVSTTARSNASLSLIRLDRMFLGAFAVCLTLTLMALVRMSRAARLLALCAACLGVILIASCGGGGGNSGGGTTGTPAGTYTLTVTASNGSNTQTMNLMLNVN